MNDKQAQNRKNTKRVHYDLANAFVAITLIMENLMSDHPKKDPHRPN